MKQRGTEEYSMSLYLDNTNHGDYWYELFDGNKNGLYGGSDLKLSPDYKDLIDKEKKKEEEEVTWIQNSSQDFWQLDNVKVFFSDNMHTPIHQGSACISMDSPHLLLSKKSKELRTKITKRIEEKTKPGTQPSISNAPKLVIKLATTNGEEKEITISQKDYLYYQRDLNISISIGSGDDLTPRQCSNESEFGFGRMFLFKKLLIFKLKFIQSNGVVESQVGVSDYNQRPKLKDPSNENGGFEFDKTILIYSIASAFLLIISCTFIIRCFRGGRKDRNSVDKDSLRLSFNSLNQDTKVIGLDTDTARGFTDRNNQKSDRLDYFVKAKNVI